MLNKENLMTKEKKDILVAKEIAQIKAEYFLKISAETNDKNVFFVDLPVKLKIEEHHELLVNLSKKIRELAEQQKKQREETAKKNEEKIQEVEPEEKK